MSSAATIVLTFEPQPLRDVSNSLLQHLPCHFLIHSLFRPPYHRPQPVGAQAETVASCICREMGRSDDENGRRRRRHRDRHERLHSGDRGYKSEDNRSKERTKSSKHQVPSPPRVNTEEDATVVEVRQSRARQVPSPPRIKSQESARAIYVRHIPAPSTRVRRSYSDTGGERLRNWEHPDELARLNNPSGYLAVPGQIVPKVVVTSERQQSEIHDEPQIEKNRPFSPLKTPQLARSAVSSSNLPSMTTTQSETYEYRKLSQEQFRLVMLFPPANGNPSAIIQCHILNCSLRIPEYRYTAVSYAWGDVGDSTEILVDHVKMSVLSSLDGALRALRHLDKEVFVWADAICIDQANFSERSEQVKLMPQIYRKASSVAVWLGPANNDSSLAFDTIAGLARGAQIPSSITDNTKVPFNERHFAAVVSLYDRDYWQRLWVVQEVFNADSITVYCGDLNLPWRDFKTASKTLRDNASLLERTFPPGHRNKYYQAQFLSNAQVLLHQGPRSLDLIGSSADFERLDDLPDEKLFEHLLRVMRACRRKLSSDPKDKIFGIQGVLSQRIRREIIVDYKLSVKDVYLNIVDILLQKTACLDIICESIHFPTYMNNNNLLPSSVPDWSHVPSTAPIGMIHDFSASANSKTTASSVEKGKLRISAIQLGRIKDHGVAVGTLCTLSDYLMAFLHWRAMLLDAFDGRTKKTVIRAQRAFCLTLSLHSLLRKYKAPQDWMDVCYYAFASSIRDRLPKLAIDTALAAYTDMNFAMNKEQLRLFIQEYFGSKMMGRCFCITDEDQIGLGTGFMARDDLVVVPLGCSTPVILRPEGREYRFVGDVYVYGYMDGEAVREYECGSSGRHLREFLLH